MKKPGRIPIINAKHLSVAYRCPVVVIFAIHDNHKEFTVTTYGATKKYCKLAAEYGEQLSKAVWNVAPNLQKEPPYQVDEPAVFAGSLARKETP